MKKLCFLILFFSLFAFSQKHKEIVTEASIEARGILMKGIGNNVFGKSLRSFFGFGFGANLNTYTNFGLSVEYNIFKSSPVYGQEHLYGEIGFPTLSNVEVSAFYRHEINEDFHLEPLAGVSFYGIKAVYLNSSNTFAENNANFHLGMRAILSLNREGFQQVVFAVKGNYYKNHTKNDNNDVERFFSQTFFVSASIGYRYVF